MTQATEDEKLTLSTGITVGIRKISPYTRDAIARAFPPPKPPMVQAEFGPDDVREEPNEADPDYQAALQAHNLFIAEKLQSVLLRLGVVVDIDHERLEIFRAAMAEIGVETDPDDHMAYVKYIAIGTPEDLARLGAAIVGKSEPTEEAVAAAVATFPGDVPGA